MLLAIAALLLPLTYVAAQPRQTDQTQSNTSVTLRWGPRPGVFRYRLQLSADRDFTDIVFDRLVSGNQTEVNDLPPGRYFWRIAPLTANLGEFSSAGIVEVGPRSLSGASPATPAPTSAIAAQLQTTNSIVAGGGWRTAIGELNAPQLAHLRRSDSSDIVVTNSDGVIYALDAATGVALWAVRVSRERVAGRTAVISEPLIVSSRSHLDNVIVVAGSSVVELGGATGSELWRRALPAFGCCAFTIADQQTTNIAVVDISSRRLFLLNDIDGSLISEINLPGRVVGKPSPLEGYSPGAFILAYDNGQIEIRDRRGTLLRSGSATSQALTPPIMVRGRNGNLILVGTRDGLTALTADTLQPLGRVALQNDVPRGMLSAQDLDGDGIAEILMKTVRGHVVVINATDGKILWDVAVHNGNGNFAFADLNRDGVTDVLTTDGPAMIALSGRDGSELWKESESSIVANHTISSGNQSLIALPSGAGALVITNEPGRGGLRAITLANAGVRPIKR